MNIYIQNDKEIRTICQGKAPKGKWENDVGVAFDIFEQRHGLKHDDRGRAEYKEYCGLPLSDAEDRMLHPKKYED